MGNTFSMQASHKLGFLHHIRLVPLFSSILGGILLLFALSAGLAGYFLLQADRDQRDATDEIQVRMGLSNSANHLRTARINMIHAGAASRIAEMDEMKANIAAAETRIKQSQDGFNAYMSRAVKTPADDALDNELNARYTAYINGLQPMLKFAKNGMFEAIINHENEQAKQLDAAYNHVLLKAIELRTERARLLSEQAYQRTRLGMMFMIGAFTLALVLTLMTFMVLRRTVIQPLQQSASRIERIAAGDLTMADEPTGRSEIGRLSHHLQQMQHALQQTVGAVRQGAEEIYRGTSEITAGNTDLSSRTEQQAAAIEQTAASMEQLTATVKQNADNAHHASKLAEDASGKASRGGQMVSGVVQTMGNISTSSKKISESRSAQAAKEIEGLIGASVSLIEQGSEEVIAAGSTMNEIVDAVKRVTDIMLDIAAASDEQSRGIVQVSQAISEMDKVTQQNASLVEEASAAAASLEEQAARLTQAVDAFHLQDTGATMRSSFL
ncbi:Tar ligand binding domain-containing protein [Salmonella enterica]